MFLPISLLAQKTHKVTAKESLYSIGRKYKVHPKELAAYNHLSLEDGVKIGQVLKIPAKKKMAALEEENPTESKSEPTDNSSSKKKDKVKKTENSDSKQESDEVASDNNTDTESKPLLHKVGKKETLFQISKKNKVAVKDLKKWNHLKKDAVKAGTTLIIGFEKSNKKKKVAVSAEQPEIAEAKKQTKKDTKAKSTVESVVTDKQENVAENTTSKEASQNIDQNPNATVPPQKNKTEESKDNLGGYFAKDFNHQIGEKATPSEQKGLASTFKSTSGWDDGRYYCLTNTAPAGTIIKVLNPTNQNFVYAKVLDVIPDLKQNEGVIIVISKAGAEKLSPTTDKFDVELSY